MRRRDEKVTGQSVTVVRDGTRADRANRLVHAIRAIPGNVDATYRAPVSRPVVAPGQRFDPAIVEPVFAASRLVMAQVDLRTRRVVAITAGAAELLGVTPDAAIGRPVSDWVDDDVSSGGLPLLATGRLDGFEASRRLHRSDGSTVDTYIWAHVLGDERPAPYGIAIAAHTPADVVLAEASADVSAIGTVDDEWRIDRISVEIAPLLGYAPEQLHGAPMLSAVHPNDLADLLAGLALMRENQRSVMVRVRLRTAAGAWLLCRARLTSLDDSPRFAFTLRPSWVPTSGADRDQELKQHLDRLAHEVKMAAASMSPARAPTVRDMPSLSSLTTREWEVLVRLADGARARTIAKDLGLSVGTVRNHLSGVFQKLGVTSQAELLERLRHHAEPLQQPS